MSEEFIINLTREAILTTFLVASPMLLSALAVGLLVSLIQAVTQVQEMTLIFVPKIIVVALALIIACPWLLKLLLGFTIKLFVGASSLTG